MGTAQRASPACKEIFQYPLEGKRKINFILYYLLGLYCRNKYNQMKIEVMDKGPYVVKGKNTIVNKDGSVAESENDTYLCRCGQSNNKPNCDGTHRNVDFD